MRHLLQRLALLGLLVVLSGGAGCFRVYKERPFRETYLKAWEGVIPDEIARKIRNGTVVIGMTENQVRAAWGLPRKVHRSYFKGGTPRQQWVYSSQYLYFEEGTYRGRKKMLLVGWN
jgi:hypothetical protein